MKHIFKKLHKGGSHESNRSSESSMTASTSGASNQRHDSSDSTNTTATPSSLLTSANDTSSAVAVGPASEATRSDYLSSEEDFQMQLALAISASSSNSDLRDDREREQIRAATLLSLGGNRIDALRDTGGSAEALSKQYWAYNVLDYEEKVVDGFYDIFKISAGLGNQVSMPSLSDLEVNLGNSDFEVVMANRTIDSSLDELMQIAHCMALDCSLLDVGVLVQRLAELVTQHMGGPVIDANITMTKWVEKSLELRASLRTSIIPIGSINVGLSRHRALLFKVLADAIGIPCRLVKGSHYTGVEDDAVNIIKLDNDRECLVDLMAAPGTLIPSDVLSIKDTTCKSYNPERSSNQSFSLLDDFDAFQSRQMAWRGGQGGASQLLAEHNNLSVNITLHPENMKKSSSSSENHYDLDRFSEFSTRADVSACLDSPTAANSTCNQKGDIVLSANTSVKNHDIVSCAKEDADHSKNLFADLNPFQVKASNKMYMLNKIGKSPKQHNNIISYQPPMPLAWKNDRAFNDVPLTKDLEIFGRLLPSNIHQLNDQKLTPLDAPAATLGSGHANVLNNSSYLTPKSTEINDGSFVVRTDFAPEEGQCSALVQEENMRLNNEHEKVNGFSVTDMEEMRDDKRINDMGQRTEPYDHYGVAIMKNNDIGGLRSSEVTSTSNAGDMLDDVGDCEIPWEDFVIGERIGLGSYGEVYRADWNGTEVAVKKFLDQDFLGAALAEFKREVRIMQRLRHPNIVLFMGAVTRPPNLSIVTEFLPRGSLYRILHRPQCQISEKRRLRMALDVAKGMNCLHSSMPTIVHRDLKSPNLLVDNNWNVKVCDFGMSRLKHNTFLSSKSTAGTPEWMAPEVLRNEPSNEKCDVYSFGVILWELATLRLPWSGMNPMQVVGAVGFQNRRLEIPKDVDPLVSHIISECWQRDPSKRPSFAQLAVTLKPLQHLIIPSLVDQQSLSAFVPHIPVSSTP